MCALLASVAIFNLTHDSQHTIEHVHMHVPDPIDPEFPFVLQKANYYSCMHTMAMHQFNVCSMCMCSAIWYTCICFTWNDKDTTISYNISNKIGAYK